jgi:hypothetical protein
MVINIALVWYAVIVLANLVIKEKTPLYSLLLAGSLPINNNTLSLFAWWWIIVIAGI